MNRFQFGSQMISTRVFMMVPAGIASRAPLVDVTSAMDEHPRERAVLLKTVADDPFADVVV